MHTLLHQKAVAALAALLTVCAALVSGCDEQQTPPKAAKEKPVIGVLVYKQDDTYISLVTKAIQETLAGRADVDILYAGSDQLVQNEQIDAMLTKHVDALALNIVEPQAASKAVDAIKKTDIPVVFFNREPDLNSIKDYSKARFVGTNAFDAGIMQGDIIAGLWSRHPEYDRNKDNKFQYIMLQANLDNPEAIARTEFSVKQARSQGVDMQQVNETLLCNWDEGMAHEAMSLVLPFLSEKLELVIANNDSMALGAIRALNESGYNLEGGNPDKFIPVVGVDAVPLAIEAIQKGMMSGTVVQDGNGMGKAVATMVLNAIKGTDYLENLPYTWDDSGLAIRIPYSRYGGDK